MAPSASAAAQPLVASLPFVNSAAMNAYLTETARMVGPGAVAIPVLDGTVWHSSKTLAVPDNGSLLPQRPCGPALHPVENVGQYMRANSLAFGVFHDYPAIVLAGCMARNRCADDPKTVPSITDRQWAQVNLQGRW